MAVGPQIPYLNNVPEFPIEIDGGPLISTDETTKSISVTRFYAVRTDRYRPLMLNAAYNQTQIDYQYTDCYLISENVTNVIGPVTYFQRNFGQVPVTRDEPRSYAFTFPGQSAVQYSEISGRAIGWDPYGKARPYTRVVKANVRYTYAINGVFNQPTLTRISYQGLPVDYVGFVYVYAGNILRPYLGNIISEPVWNVAGATDPVIIPAEWTQEVNVTRWRGPIWQMEVITVDTNQFD